MRFGISATSWIFPKNLRTRLRPVNVCAIWSLAVCRTVGPGTTLRKAAIHRDRQDSRQVPFLVRSRLRRIAVLLLPLAGYMGDSGSVHPEITRFFDSYLSSTLAPAF